ncbi:MAG: DinB family protein [Gemmatimonadales bacterium]
MSNALLLRAVQMTIIRDLHALEREIEAYPDDDSLWLTPPGISNSAGNLALHLAGNLRHFIGGTLGSTGYVRNRDVEFATKGISRSQVAEEIRNTIADVDRTLSDLDDSRIESGFPIPVGPQSKNVTTSDWLVHLAGHLTYHLGQIDYHRRLLTADGTTVDTLSLKDIPELKG